MGQVPELENYSAEDLALAQKKSSALDHYLKLITRTENQQLDRLRKDRHRAWSRAALATILNRASAADVCTFWSESADQIVKEAWIQSGCHNHSMALFALGKWGSKELNLSSDIDIILISSESPNAQEFLAAKKLIQVLNQSTEFGFCFRVDTDLKPGGRLAPIITSLKQLEDYYWSSGATWERLALVRIRSICGDTSVVKSAKEIIDKFVFRRHLDFTLLEDLKHLRSQIHFHYAPKNSVEINLKLCPGGIRDIELFIHALQVIHGGKNTNLRTTSTTRAAELLVKENRFGASEMDLLIRTYWRLRQFENFVQALSDNQTHIWSEVSLGPLPVDLRTDMSASIKIVETLLGRSDKSNPEVFTEPLRSQWLEKIGLKSDESNSQIEKLLDLTALSTRTLQDEEFRKKVLKRFVEKIAERALDKQLALGLLIDFFKATRAKASFFALLLHEERLIDELSVLFGSSPYLGGILASRPELLDSYIFRAQARPPANMELLLEDLVERKLLNEIISSNRFLLHQNLEQFNLDLTVSADEICLLLLDSLKADIGESSIEILALGKWGGNELGIKSDLDFILVTADAPTDIDHKIARRFISRLNEQHRGGNIYSIDMRLRPSGKGGPILVSRDQLIHYLEEAAEPWERQSYLKARIVGQPNNTPNSNNSQTDEGDITPFAHRVHKACSGKILGEKDFHQFIHIKQSLKKTSDNDLEIKYDSGGLVDIEFASQIAILQHQVVLNQTSTVDMLMAIRKIHVANVNTAEAIQKLAANYSFLRNVEQLYSLATQHPGSSIKVSEDGFRRVSKMAHISPEHLHKKILNSLKENTQLLTLFDPRKDFEKS